MTRSNNLNKTFVLIISILCLILYFVPSKFPNPQEGDNYIRTKALVTDVDNSYIIQRGIVKTGVQRVTIKIIDGIYRDQSITTSNNLIGKLELDKIFQVGESAFVVITGDGTILTNANLIDHYRLDVQTILFFLFIILLLWFAGWTGAKAVLSFVFTILVLWKMLLPMFLLGYDPIISSILAVCAITGAVTFLVAGVNKTGLSAFLGTISGALAACLLSIIFGYLFKIHGAVIPYSETLLNVGFSNINLTKIFLAGIFLASSGAMMDVAMDISVAVKELVENNPQISKKEAIKSGFEVGKAVVGAMTTTLLLAYSSSFTGLMMVFIAQGTPYINILNLTYISAEILHTLVGSIGVVLVAPFTAFLAGILLTKNEH